MQDFRYSINLLRAFFGLSYSRNPHMRRQLSWWSSAASFFFSARQVRDEKPFYSTGNVTQAKRRYGYAGGRHLACVAARILTSRCSLTALGPRSTRAAAGTHRLR